MWYKSATRLVPLAPRIEPSSSPPIDLAITSLYFMSARDLTTVDELVYTTSTKLHNNTSARNPRGLIVAIPQISPSSTNIFLVESDPEDEEDQDEASSPSSGRDQNVQRSPTEFHPRLKRNPFLEESSLHSSNEESDVIVGQASQGPKYRD